MGEVTFGKPPTDYGPWVTCAHCGKSLKVDEEEPERLEELRDEGWYEIFGQWYCNECSPAPATRAWIAGMTQWMNGLVGRINGIDDRTKGLGTYGPIREVRTWQGANLLEGMDPELVDKIAQAAVDSERTSLRSLGSFLTRHPKPDPAPQPPSGAPFTPGDTPSG